MAEVFTWIEKNWLSLGILATILGFLFKTYTLVLKEIWKGKGNLEKIDEREESLNNDLTAIKEKLEFIGSISEHQQALIEEQRETLTAESEKLVVIKEGVSSITDTLNHLKTSQRIFMSHTLRELSTTYIEAKSISLENRSSFDRMYQSYKKDLGANGDMANRYDLVMKLPLSDEE